MRTYLRPDIVPKIFLCFLAIYCVGFETCRSRFFSLDIRINTIKHAMVGQLQNPSPGFEDVIRAHFYLKKDQILEVSWEWTVVFELFLQSLD